MLATGGLGPMPLNTGGGIGNQVLANSQLNQIAAQQQLQQMQNAANLNGNLLQQAALTQNPLMKNQALMQQQAALTQNPLMKNQALMQQQAAQQQAAAMQKQALMQQMNTQAAQQQAAALQAVNAFGVAQQSTPSFPGANPLGAMQQQPVNGLVPTPLNAFMGGISGGNPMVQPRPLGPSMPQLQVQNGLSMPTPAIGVNPQAALQNQVVQNALQNQVLAQQQVAQNAAAMQQQGGIPQNPLINPMPSLNLPNLGGNPAQQKNILGDVPGVQPQLPGSLLGGQQIGGGIWPIPGVQAQPSPGLQQIPTPGNGNSLLNGPLGNFQGNQGPNQVPQLPAFMGLNGSPQQQTQPAQVTNSLRQVSESNVIGMGTLTNQGGNSAAQQQQQQQQQQQHQQQQLQGGVQFPGQPQQQPVQFSLPGLPQESYPNMMNPGQMGGLQKQPSVIGNQL